MNIFGIRLRAVLKNIPPENSSSVAIMYYLQVNFVFRTIKDMVNNILEYYYPFTFPSIKKIPKQRFFTREPRQVLPRL